MTREELKTHCIKQIENCEMWAKFHGEEPHGKIYEEHKLILELLEQESVFDKIKAEIDELPSYVAKFNGGDFAIHIDKEKVFEVIDKYKGSEGEE